MQVKQIGGIIYLLTQLRNHNNKERTLNLEITFTVEPAPKVYSDKGLRVLGFTRFGLKKQKITYYLSNLWAESKIEEKPEASFLTYLFEVELHEIIHGIGYAWGIKGYSSSKKDHYKETTGHLVSELAKVWTENKHIHKVIEDWIDLNVPQETDHV